jgi:hypothetical protein
VADKVYSVEASVAALAPGPWTPFSPLLPGWSVGPSGFAYARYRPDDNSVELLFDVSVTSTVTAAEQADNYQWAVMPAADALGNGLLPPQTGEVLVSTDHIQSTTPGVPRVRIQPGGQVRLYGISTASTFMRCHCQRYTLDALGV